MSSSDPICVYFTAQKAEESAWVAMKTLAAEIIDVSNKLALLPNVAFSAAYFDGRIIHDNAFTSNPLPKIAINELPPLESIRHAKEAWAKSRDVILQAFESIPDLYAERSRHPLRGDDKPSGPDDAINVRRLQNGV